MICIWIVVIQTNLVKHEGMLIAIYLRESEHSAGDQFAKLFPRRGLTDGEAFQG